MTLRPVNEAYLAERKARHESELADEPILKGGGPGGTSTPMTNDGLKSRVDLLQALVLLFLASLIGLAVAMVTSANTTNGRIDTVQKSLSDLNREVGEVSAKSDESNRRLDRIEGKLDRIAEKLK